jgi:hypothetical protein
MNQYASSNIKGIVLSITTKPITTGYKLNMEVGVGRSYTKKDGEEVHSNHKFTVVAYNNEARAVKEGEHHEKVAQCKEGDLVKLFGWLETFETETKTYTYIKLVELEVLESAGGEAYDEDIPF